MVVERQLIPEGLAQMAPGLELAAVLAGLDVARLSGYDAVVVLQACARLEAHVQAAKAAVMAEVGLYEVAPCDMKKMAEPDKYSADEIRAALTLTRRAAEREYGFAYDLKTRLPRVRRALSAGTIDKPRALVFCDWLADVPAELAGAVADRLVPTAGRWTTSELKDKIKRELIAADPQWARRRYERALRQRRVEGVPHADGTATITGHQLPVDQAAAAIARVDQIARTAKRAGLAAPIDHIRADVFLGLLDATFAGLDDEAIVAVLLERAAHTTATGQEDDLDHDLADHSGDRPSTHHENHPGNPCGSHGGEYPGNQCGAPTDPTTDVPGPRPGGAADGVSEVAGSRLGGPADRAADALGPGLGGAVASRVESAGLSRGVAGDGIGYAGAGGAGDGAAGPPGGSPGGSSVGVAGYAAGELRVRVSTLMHLDDLPAELAGWGPLHAPLARQVAKRQTGGEWRFAICDAAGHLLFAGITRRRPTGWPRRPVSGPARGIQPATGSARGTRSRGIVELQLPLAQLEHLHAQLTELGGWAPVIADITRQLHHATIGDTTGRETTGGETGAGEPTTAISGAANREASGGEIVEGKPTTAISGAANWEAMARQTAAIRGAANWETAGSVMVVDERRRFAVAGLRRWVQIRDRVCTYPGCRAPATRSELDHTREYARGGLTLAGNLAAACAHDHDLRDHGWRVVQPAPGRVVWISRTGHRYGVRPPPIIESLPEPIIPSIHQPVPEIDLPLPSTWEYSPPWLQPCAEHPKPSPDATTGSPPTPTPPPSPEDDTPPF